MRNPINRQKQRNNTRARIKKKTNFKKTACRVGGSLCCFVFLVCFEFGRLFVVLSCLCLCLFVLGGRCCFSPFSCVCWCVLFLLCSCLSLNCLCLLFAALLLFAFVFLGVLFLLVCLLCLLLFVSVVRNPIVNGMSGKRQGSCKPRTSGSWLDACSCDAASLKQSHRMPKAILPRAISSIYLNVSISLGHHQGDTRVKPVRQSDKASIGPGQSLCGDWIKRKYNWGSA